MKKLKNDLQAVLKSLKVITKKAEQLTKKVDKLEKAQPKAKAKTAKKVPVKKKASPGKKAAKLTATDRVLRLVRQSKKGVAVPALMKKTGFDEMKVRNIVSRAFTEGKIKRASRGTYVGA